jgi:hypothetical protein
MSQRKRIERGVELLILCQHLQSEKDGVDRPEPGGIDKSKRSMSLLWTLRGQSQICRLAIS